MDTTAVIIGIATLFKPFFEKAGGKAAETIGEKLAESAADRYSSVWQKIKRLFIIDDDQKTIERIEKKQTLDDNDIKIIEDKLLKKQDEIQELANEIKEIFNINNTREYLINEKCKSINRLKENISKLEIQMERAGISSTGDYQNRIELQTDKLNSQVKELVDKLLNNG